MAYVIGPNGVRTYVPDDIAGSLVGDGERGYKHAPEEAPEAEKPKAPARRTTTRARKSAT
ncbi:hypothetical protein PP629_gp07 [Streptomyces phage Dubu]|uniref:Uncharacterized protein n=1 Tax=Streptomyces phage Dubu TaxID=2591226 RepID=A0A514DES9_9CAUD|nr:hypothetical protein PP629_gp07 [Streptomyces phage Dubu]QDH92112.1 hypothetical protein SEA_DUBU_7 [Streptomyces phage Dubu]